MESYLFYGKMGWYKERRCFVIWLGLRIDDCVSLSYLAEKV